MPPKGVKTLPPAVDPDVDSPAAQQEQSHLSGMADFELPRTTLIKLAKGSIPDNVKMQQDVVMALMRSSTLFISYLAAASHDQAINRSGKTVTPADVLKAISELDFGPADNLIPLLERELAGAYTELHR
ncbi:uncharacterized protein MKK02DRAFT_42616 [Dioszegia hungarica]|uniref:DNA polymerase epsilon subunit D n=1 Tax=Dioszegia hungarica TaxID=4972 RepID=A0AA38HD82_9TREE|nr:uncharacterized protein MKK02DRAFT_42616 [Dioszegia hungarica]KAI9638226.1 hypothetical protein MKK02DRAFT_42616 [Dioszegia hungarica]